MDKPRILIVEDEVSHQLLIQKALEGQFEICLASTYAEAKTLIERESFDLFLLDIMLDEHDGFELCAQIKAFEKHKMMPIIFLSSRAEVTSKVLGFTLGADDYIVKPCDPMELRARIVSKLKRNQEMEKQERHLEVGDLLFHVDQQKIEVKPGAGEESPFELTPLEFKLMYYLARHQDHVLSRNQILDNVWGQSTNVLDRTVDTYIAALRKKLGVRAKYIRSVHGVGYRFSPEEAFSGRRSA